MKKHLLSLLLLSAAPTGAQVPLHTVVTHFTNTKCSICASRNPGFHKNVSAHPELTLLTVHPSSPYAACVLSKQNTADNDALTKKYGVYGATPRLVINGDVIPAVADYSASALFSPYLGLTSPFGIRIEQTNHGADSISTKVILRKHTALSGEGYLFLGLVEDSVFVNGGNGETEHYNVLRKSLTAADGTAVALDFPAADSLVLHFSGKQASFWDINRMFAIAMLSGKDNKLIQSARSFPSHTNAVPMVPAPNGYSVWPNPVKDLLMVHTAENVPASYLVYNMLGNIVLQGGFSGNTMIDMSSLPAAPYLLYLSSANRSLPYRLLVRH